jgi:hypothetical protein
MDYNELVFAFLVHKEVTKRVLGELERGEVTEDRMEERIAVQTYQVVKGVKRHAELIRDAFDAD